MEKIEIEVKFYLSDPVTIRNRIIDLCAQSMGRVFETNIRFEDAGKTLIQNRSLLRLRWDTRATLTFKSEPSVKDNQFKTLRELEVEVGDFSTIRRILSNLGFHEEQTYEKWREMLVFDGTKFCMDSLPFGDFLEIEGEAEDIRHLSSVIDLKWEKRILLNYLEMFDIIKQKMDLPFSDVTFSNFKNFRIDLAAYLQLFEAGH
ncbi:MAG: class IV adenylate cyclase [Deltaproteobacteria bacterium]|nr:class IV adenylate cyclase [Deltaproteobacteria bacterium]